MLAIGILYVCNIKTFLNAAHMGPYMIIIHVRTYVHYNNHMIGDCTSIGLLLGWQQPVD